MKSKLRLFMAMLFLLMTGSTFAQIPGGGDIAAAITYLCSDRATTYSQHTPANYTGPLYQARTPGVGEVYQEGAWTDRVPTHGGADDCVEGTVLGFEIGEGVERNGKITYATLLYRGQTYQGRFIVFAQEGAVKCPETLVERGWYKKTLAPSTLFLGFTDFTAEGLDYMPGGTGTSQYSELGGITVEFVHCCMVVNSATQPGGAAQQRRSNHGKADRYYPFRNLNEIPVIQYWALTGAFSEAIPPGSFGVYVPGENVNGVGFAYSQWSIGMYHVVTPAPPSVIRDPSTRPEGTHYKPLGPGNGASFIIVQVPNMSARVR